MPKYKIVQTGVFKKDLKLAIRRGYNTDLLGFVVDFLAAGEPLPEKYKDHNEWKKEGWIQYDSLRKYRPEGYTEYENKLDSIYKKQDDYADKQRIYSNTCNMGILIALIVGIILVFLSFKKKG